MEEDKSFYNRVYPKIQGVSGKVIVTSVPTGSSPDFIKHLWMNPLVDIERLAKPLTNAQIRDWSMIRQFIENGEWWTSIRLAKAMYSDGNFTNREIKRVSNILSNLFHNTSLLERKEKRRIYFNNIHKKHLSTWAYRLNRNLITESNERTLGCITWDGIGPRYNGELDQE